MFIQSLRVFIKPYGRLIYLQVAVIGSNHSGFETKHENGTKEYMETRTKDKSFSLYNAFGYSVNCFLFDFFISLHDKQFKMFEMTKSIDFFEHL